METFKKGVIKLLSNVYKFYLFFYLKEMSFLIINKKIRFHSLKVGQQISSTFIYCININKYLIYTFSPFGSKGPEIFYCVIDIWLQIFCMVISGL